MAGAGQAPIRPPTACWYVRGPVHPVTGLAAVTCQRGGVHADGTTVAPDADLGGAVELWRAEPDRDGRPVVRAAGAADGGTGGIWYVLVEDLEAEASDDAVDLIAFATADVTAGTVITADGFAALPVASEEQVGAIRWSRRTATIDQVYVLPERRRRQLGTLLVYAASAVHQSAGWPGALHADGRRTLLGDRLAGALPHPQRVADLTHRAAPMDATDATDA